VRRSFPAASSSPWLEEILADPRFAAPAEPLETAAVVRELFEAEPDQRLQILQAYLQEQIARSMGARPGPIDLHQPLTNLGIDSLMAMELRNRVEDELRVEIRLVDFLQGPTVASLSEMLLTQLTERNDSAIDRFPDPDEDIQVPSADVSSANIQEGDSRRLLETLDDLSDEEVDVLLKEVLRKRAGSA
jgi:acyl carrier protein